MRRHRLAGLCTLTLLMCCGVMVAQAPSTGSVQGVVRDADTGTLLGGVEVELDINSRTPPRATTDAQGRYEMSNIPAGLTRVSLRRLFLNIAPPAVTATVREGQTTSMPELRVRLRGGMSGRVIDDTGQPLTGAFVMVVTRVFTRTGSGPLNELAGARLWIHRNSSTTTDDQGRFTFQMLE
jgi:hypothetical protein